MGLIQSDDEIKTKNRAAAAAQGTPAPVPANSGKALSWYNAWARTVGPYDPRYPSIVTITGDVGADFSGAYPITDRALLEGKIRYLGSLGAVPDSRQGLGEAFFQATFERQLQQRDPKIAEQLQKEDGSGLVDRALFAYAEMSNLLHAYETHVANLDPTDLSEFHAAEGLFANVETDIEIGDFATAAAHGRAALAQLRDASAELKAFATHGQQPASTPFDLRAECDLLRQYGTLAAFWAAWLEQQRDTTGVQGAGGDRS